jgi:hypothetical protein
MRTRLNAFFAISVNSPPLSMVNFSSCVCSAPKPCARSVIRRVTPQPMRAAVRTEAGAHACPAHERASAGFSVVELTRLLWRRRVMIAATALICACLAVAIGKSLTPKYLATSQLYVDPRELQLVDRELTPRAQDVSGMAMVVESQARLITSNSVLLQVIPIWTRTLSSAGSPRA